MLPRHVETDRALARSEGLPSVYLPENSIGTKTLYMNCGYWAGAPAGYDEACEALITLVATSARIGAGDDVLDIGFGYADQTELLLRKYGPPRSIIGLNVSAFQVDTAKRRLAGHPLAGRVDLRVGDAVATGLPDASVDVVMAIECSAHFRTRDTFLAEAMRILRPGGRLAICDVLAFDGPLKLISRNIVRNLLAFWQAPRENLYTARTYAERIAKAGFTNVDILSIKDDVYPALLSHAYGVAKRGELPKSMGLGLRFGYRVLTAAQQAYKYRIPFDYAVAIAVKPA